MKKFKEQMQRAAQKTQMSVSERKDVRARLSSYMEYHPLPERTSAVKARQYLASQSFVMVKLNTFYTRVAASVFAVLLIVGVPLVAERAAPGDVLYPVKVRFNEEVRSTLTLSPYEKVAWETERLERRIAEARLLASEGKLTIEAEAEVTEAVREQTETIGEEIAALRSSDAEEAAIAEIAFESALEVQSVVLAGGDSASTTEGASILAIAGAVADAQVAAEAVRGTTTPSFDRLSGRIEIETTRAFELLKSVEEIATAEEVIDINRRLEDIGRTVTEAGALRDTDEVAAQALLTDALSRTRKLISFMADIDVRASVSVEELVPVELTTDERTEALRVLLEEAETAQEAAEAAVILIESVDARTKMELGMEMLTSHISTLEEALITADIAKGELVAEDAKALASDLTIMSETQMNENAPVIPVDETASTTDPVIEEETASTTEELASELEEEGAESEAAVEETEDSSTESNQDETL